MVLDFHLHQIMWNGKIQHRSNMNTTAKSTQPTDINTLSDQTALSSSHQDTAGILTPESGGLDLGQVS